MVNEFLFLLLYIDDLECVVRLCPELRFVTPNLRLDGVFSDELIDMDRFGLTDATNTVSVWRQQVHDGRTGCIGQWPETRCLLATT